MRKTILATLLVVVAAAPGAHIRAGLAYLSTSRPANSWPRKSGIDRYAQDGRTLKVSLTSADGREVAL